MRNIVKYIFIAMTICGGLFMTSCKKHVGPTVIMVQDSIRHYYPVLQGQEVEIAYRVANIGNVPLVLTDIHPSCGCISVNESTNNIILPGKEQTLKFIYNSTKNVGFVEHNIYLYGNIAPSGMAIIRFDINVVPPYGSAPDYEEYYYEHEKAERFAKGITDGFENQRGYWINDGDYPEDYSRNYKKYPWREIEKKK